MIGASIKLSLEGNKIEVVVKHEQGTVNMTFDSKGLLNFEAIIPSIITFLKGMDVQDVKVDRYQSAVIKQRLESNGFSVKYAEF